MTSQGRDFPGHIRAGGGQESGAPWVEATLTMVGDVAVVMVNQTEVARLTSPRITDTAQNDVYRIEGADQPLFFRPRDWERLAGLSGEFEDIIANDLPSGQALVEIADDDVAFSSTGCGDWTPRS